MDPVTIWLFCLATAWLLRLAFEDGVAVVRGTETPRVARRRAGLTVWAALWERIARRISQGGRTGEPGAFRRYLRQVWDDAWTDASDAHERRRQARLHRRHTAPPPDPAEQTDDDLADDQVWDTRPCAGGCGVLVIDPDTHCTACTGPREPQPPPPTPPTRNTTTRKAPPMTSPHTINGDVMSPTDALAYATQSMDLALAIADELEVAINNLAGLGVAGAAMGELWGMARDEREFADAADRARIVYARHVRAQAELAGDTDLAASVAGTYLDTATV